MNQEVKAKYQKVANQIKSDILQGNYSIGSAIPSEFQLQGIYQVSRHTVRQGIAELVNEGYLRKEKGSGTFVSDMYLKSNAGSNKVIGVITTYMSDYIFPAIIRGIEKELSDRGYSLLFSITNNDIEQEKKCLEKMLSQNISGLIVEPTQSNRFNPNLNYYLSFQSRNVPIIMLNAKYDELDIPCVRVDDVQSGYIATNYLIDRGHQHIALVTKIDDMQGRDRMKGFVRAFSEHEMTFDSRDIITYTTGNNQLILSQLGSNFSTNHDKITGIVCYNDEIALEIVDWLNQNNCKVPKDVSLVSHDNSFLSTVSSVKLTSVDHPKEKLGHEVACRIIKEVESSAKEQTDTIFAPQLILRQSVMNIKI